MRIKVKVLRSFPYLDGTVSREIKADTLDEVEGDHFDGLKARGFVEAVDVAVRAASEDMTLALDDSRPKLTLPERKRR